ncbi:DUF2339 domain-containing protein [Rhizobium sp. LjRoot254]|uniref:DUF2339 domain-containing protein n=1 Tax=Rhizobium sp. LjRoot254 TaxID=3342297 RepID=UPI003ECD8CDA
MFELLSLISIVLAIVGLSTARGVRARLETEIAALKLELKRVEGMRPAAADSSTDETAALPEAAPEASSEAVAVAAMEVAPEQVTEDVPEPAASMEAADEPVKPTISEPAKPAVAKPSWESRIAAQWTVWVGGIALAFAGIFAIKYSIDQGFFSPEVRLSAAALFGLLLVAGGEFLRRQTKPLVENAFQNAMIPGVLTAAGTLTLFGSVYVAHGVYGFIGPATAFILLALISFMTIGLSMLYGQALAGLGLLASFTTPLLVASKSPSPWSLFGFLTLVWIATILASKIQSWRVVPGIANVGLSAWAFLYLVSSRPETPFEVLPVALPMIIMIAGLAFIWPGNWVAPEEPEVREEELEIRLDSAGRPLPAAAPRVKSAWGHVFLPRHLASTLTAAIGGMIVATVFNAPDLSSTGYYYLGFAALIAGLAFFGAFRTYAIYPAIFAALGAFGGIRVLTIATASPGFQPADSFTYTDPNLVIWLALGLGLLLAVLMLTVVHFRRSSHAEFTRAWIIIGGATPLLLATVSFFFFGNYAFDLKHGLYAILLGALYLGGAWHFYGERENDGRFVPNRDLLVGASWAAFVFALLVMTNGITTTIGAAILGFAYLNAQRAKDWPVLPWAMVASAIFVAGRIAWEPTIVGTEALSKTPVFNQLLAGYGIPALLLIASAWLIRNKGDDRIRNVMDALASLFTLLTIAILVRHAMNGGVLTSDAPTLAEQSIYTLLAIGASVTLMTLDLRRPSIIFRTGSMALGYISMASILLAHFLGLNPYFTGETTGQIPFFNLLFLAYLLPGATYGGAAYVARGRRPQHYVIALALSGAALLFAYVTLSVRRFYHGADISDWKGFLQSELYTYSVVWLLLGVALLVAGYRFRSTALRIASGVLVLIAVLKVFLIDMSNLEGLYRALSFAGLGFALIGIGWFYQRALTGLAKQEKPEEPAVSET